jgi:hypothetical protein
MLADEAGVPVQAEWHPGRGYGGPLPTGATGRWVVSWVDGPTAAAMRARATELTAGLGAVLAPLRTAALTCERRHSDRAVALAVLDLARDGKLPADPQERRWRLHDTDTDLAGTPYPSDRPAAALTAAAALNAAAGGSGDAPGMGDLLAERGPAALGIDDPPPAAAGPPLRGRWVWGAWPVDGSRTRVLERRPRPAPIPA